MVLPYDDRPSEDERTSGFRIEWNDASLRSVRRRHLSMSLHPRANMTDNGIHVGFGVELAVEDDDRSAAAGAGATNG